MNVQQKLALREKKYDLIKKEIETTGASILQACEKHGLHKASFYEERTKRGESPRQTGKKPARFVNVSAPMATSSGKVVMFFGSPEEVAAAARGLM